MGTKIGKTAEKRSNDLLSTAGKRP